MTYPDGLFFHYLHDDESAAAGNEDRDIDGPEDKWALRAGDVMRQGLVRSVDGDTVWVEMFSFMDGTSDGGIYALPKGDWSRWKFYETDREMRDAYSWFGYRRGWWGYEDYLWATSNELSGVDLKVPKPPKAKPKTTTLDTPRMQFRSAMTKRRRFALLKRDGFKCRYCGSSEALQIDHVVPLAKGGTNEDDNLVTACAPCNLGKRVDLVALPDRSGTA